MLREFIKEHTVDALAKAIAKLFPRFLVRGGMVGGTWLYLTLEGTGKELRVSVSTQGGFPSSVYYGGQLVEFNDKSLLWLGKKATEELQRREQLKAQDIYSELNVHLHNGTFL